MPPKLLLKPSMKCLKFGEVLLDENRNFFFLCSYCADITSLQNFRDHLLVCDRVRHIFKAQTSTKLNCDTGETKLLTKITKDTKEVHVYGFDEKRATEDVNEIVDITGLLGIEEELLNPRWYTDATTDVKSDVTNVNDKNAPSYNDLIEEVTPFVHFKENIKTNISGRVSARLSAKQDAKDHNKSITNTRQIKEELPSPNKSLPSDNKKQARQCAIEEKPKSLENSKKVVQKPTAQTATSPTNKPRLRGTAKNLILVHNQTESTLSTTKKLPLKRKTESLPASKPTNSADQDQAEIKRRKTLAYKLQAILEPEKLSTSTTKYNEANKSTSPAKKTSAPVVNAVVLSKKENKTNLNTKKLPPRKTRSEVLNGKQLPPPQQQQQQSQIKIQSNSNQIQSSTTPIKILNNHPSLLTNNTNKIQHKEKSQAAQRVAQAVPLATSTPIEIKVSTNQPVQQTPSSLTNNNQKTVEILNKLQTLGLKIQRTNPKPEPKRNSTVTNSNEQAMEIIKKLQSKGMNVKIVQKTNTLPTKTSATPFTTLHNVPSSCLAKDGNTFNINRTSSVGKCFGIKKEFS